jgi:hypothetical protein
MLVLFPSPAKGKNSLVLLHKLRLCFAGCCCPGPLSIWGELAVPRQERIRVSKHLFYVDSIFGVCLKATMHTLANVKRGTSELIKHAQRRERGPPSSRAEISLFIFNSYWSVETVCILYIVAGTINGTKIGESIIAKYKLVSYSVFYLY